MKAGKKSSYSIPPLISVAAPRLGPTYGTCALLEDSSPPATIHLLLGQSHTAAMNHKNIFLFTLRHPHSVSDYEGREEIRFYPSTNLGSNTKTRPDTRDLLPPRGQLTTQNNPFVGRTDTQRHNVTQKQKKCYIASHP